MDWAGYPGYCREALLMRFIRMVLSGEASSISSILMRKMNFIGDEF